MRTMKIQFTSGPNKPFLGYRELKVYEDGNVIFANPFRGNNPEEQEVMIRRFGQAMRDGVNNLATELDQVMVGVDFDVRTGAMNYINGSLGRSDLLLFEEEPVFSLGEGSEATFLIEVIEDVGEALAAFIV